jgi:COMPASS component SWD1
MNLSLIDPFVLAQDYPDTLTEKLRSGHATCLRFNRKGDYLASGRVRTTLFLSAHQSRILIDTSFYR